MRGSIRNQILVPLMAVQAVAVAATAVVSARLAADIMSAAVASGRPYKMLSRTERCNSDVSCVTMPT